VEFRQIQYFVCLFEDGTVTGAARRLNIVQPALSMQIAKLEEELGQKLFERTKQGMMPTATARQMYRLFMPVLRDFSHARDQVMSTDGEISGHVNIGLIASITEGVLADTLAAFYAKYPNLRVTVADGYSTTLADWVLGGKVDAAIINKPRRSLALNMEHIVDEDLVFVTSARHPAAIPDRLTLKQIPPLGLALVLPTPSHGLRSIVDNFAVHEDVDLNPSFEVDSLVTTLKLVEQTRLATIVPRISVHRRLSEGTLQAHSIVSPRLTREVVMISHPRRPLNSATTIFIGMLTAQMQISAKKNRAEPQRQGKG
jgi:DNA-binding transcriptional LysR family regulator